jgi:hypothetical protein
MTHTDDITVKQAVDYILAQPDGKLEYGRCCIMIPLTFW